MVFDILEQSIVLGHIIGVQEIFMLCVHFVFNGLIICSGAAPSNSVGKVNESGDKGQPV